MVERTGNFVLWFVGDLSPEIVASYQQPLCTLFPAAETACTIPMAGWTWIQLCGVDNTWSKGEARVIYSREELLTAFRANPCFNTVTICVKPHWQGNPANFKGPAATVIATILDADNSICQRASSEGVCMFGRQVKFICVGDNPSLVQCLRCHEIGHYFTSPKCRWMVSRCYICGGRHNARDHGFKCWGTHCVQGMCDCTPVTVGRPECATCT
jgi:hypothetical protein